MNVALLFPTGTDPRSPYLALPSLAASLRRAGISTTLHDLDIGGLNYLLEPDNLKVAGREFRRKFSDRQDLRERRLTILSEELPELSQEYLAILRDRNAFFDANEWGTARAGLLDALDISSAAHEAALKYSIDPIDYAVSGIDPQSVRSLIAGTQDDRYNIFSGYWQRDLYFTLEQQAPVYVGITITNRQQILPGLLLARRLRERGHFVVVGGALLTKFAKKLPTLPAFFETFADAVIVYEGDTAAVALADALANNLDLSQVPNLLYLRGGRVCANVTHVEDVAFLPTPDFTGLPLDQYLSPEPVLPVLLGKGCYFNRCKFCDIPYINHISKKAYRLRSAETVVNDLRELNRKFGSRHFEFTDEALPPRTLEHLADELTSKGENRFHFVGYARLEPGFTKNVCQKLAAAGFRKFFFGLESACQATLDHMDKDINVSKVPSVLGNCRDAGIYFHVFSILGFPEETPQQAMETVQFFEDNRELLRDPGVTFDVHPFGLELRTEYAEKATSFGVLISPDALRKDFIVGVDDNWTNTRGMNPGQTLEEVNRANARLKTLYSEYHGGPQSLWPGFEEYAVLYSDYYSRQPFRFRSSLPDESEFAEYTVRWHPGVVVDDFGKDGVNVVSRFGSATVNAKTLAGIGEMSGQSLQRVLRAALNTGLPAAHGSIRANFRSVLEGLMGEGILQLVPIATGATSVEENGAGA